MPTNNDKADFRKKAKVASTVAAPAAATAAASVAAPTKAEFDKVVVDNANLRTTLTTLITNLKAAGLIK